MRLKEILTGNGKKGRRRAGSVLLAGCLLIGSTVGMAGCAGDGGKDAKQAGEKQTEEKAVADKNEETEIQVFIAASLNTVIMRKSTRK